jgi:hypothetical protein
MSDYKENEVAGRSWQRCNQVLISNPLEGAPMVRLSEESVISIDGHRFSNSLPGIQFEFDPSITIQLVNPATGAKIAGKTVTGADVYVSLYSLYIQKALERDSQNEPQADSDSP